MLDKERKMLGGLAGEFKKFIEQGSVIDMAVGVIVGSTLSNLVNSLVKDIIMPPIGLLLKGVDFSQIFIVLKHGRTQDLHYHTIAQATSDGATTLNIGLFINAFISFLIMMFTIFLIVRIVNKVRAMSKRHEAVTTRTCPYCYEIVNIAATKCPFCTAALKPIKNAAEEKEVVQVKRSARRKHDRNRKGNSRI